MSYLASLLYNNLVTIAVFLLSTTLVRRYLKLEAHLPPGPWNWPLLGYLDLFMCKDKRQLFRELREKYGNLVYLRLGRQPIVLVSGFEMIQEVLSKRAREFEGRPQVFTTLKVGQGRGVVNSSGDVWREHRQFMVTTMKGLGIGKSSFESNVSDEINPFLETIRSQRGQDFNCHHLVQTAVSNIICTIAFGKRFDYDEQEFERLMKLVNQNMKLVGGTSVVNYFPFMEKFPADPFKCQLTLNTVAEVQTMFRGWVERHRETLDAKSPRDLIDLYLLYMLENENRGVKTTFNHDQLVKFIGDMFVAGTETTATTILWSLVFLVRHPKVQTRLHEEIISTLGGDGTGTQTSLSVQDRERMPYTMATISECQRLADIAPFCVPHSNPEEVELNGYTIPKGAVVIPVLNSLHHEEDLWENPMELRPERFLDETGLKYACKREFLPFSVGSRACPGKSLALMELFLFLTSIVKHFHILPPEDGEIPSLEGHIGVTYVPNHHTFRFVPRTDDNRNHNNNNNNKNNNNNNNNNGV